MDNWDAAVLSDFEIEDVRMWFIGLLIQTAVVFGFSSHSWLLYEFLVSVYHNISLLFL